MKKVLIPINIVLAILIIALAVLLALVVVSKEEAPKKSGRRSATVAETEAAVEVENEMITEITEPGFTIDAQYVASEPEEDSDDPLHDPDGYILSNSNCAYLSESDLEDLTPQELTYGRNEIYARHGYVFESQELNDYFNSKNWYTPNRNYRAGDGFNDYETDNGEFIKAYQNEHNKTYKPQ